MATRSFFFSSKPRLMTDRAEDISDMLCSGRFEALADVTQGSNLLFAFLRRGLEGRALRAVGPPQEATAQSSHPLARPVLSLSGLVAETGRWPKEARFRSDLCALDITLTECDTTATKVKAWGTNSNVLLTRPLPDDDGNYTITWRHIMGTNTMYGWALPTLAPNDKDAYNNCGSFLAAFGSNAHSTALWGLGEKVERISAVITPGALVTLCYNPEKGTIYGCITESERRKYKGLLSTQDGLNALCFRGVRNDLVPAVLLYGKGDSCVVLSDYQHAQQQSLRVAETLPV